MLVAFALHNNAAGSMGAYASEQLAPGVRVLVASDVRLYREGLEYMLRGVPGINLVSGAISAEETLERIQDTRPSVVLLDMQMEGALTVARQIARQTRSVNVVALGMPEFETEVLSYAQVGIAGYLTRSASISDAVEAIHAAARGEVRCSPRVAGFLFRHIASLSKVRHQAAPTPALTTRESQILDLLRQGMTNKMISRTLGIELPTVKNHVHSILAKLGVHRRAEAMLLFRDESRASE
jgi:two-component system, NarL family, nitrate/nitrite response regulator NarL